MTDDASDAPRPITLAVLFVAIAALMVADIADDLRASIDTLHLILETAVVALAGAGVIVLARAAAAARAAARRLGADLTLATADARRWREEAQEALRGLGAAMDGQFARWELTDAERDIALRLLKGHGHKEIARQRDTSERTVRQQALAIYRKAGVHTRAELSAFFLQDLLLPARA